MDRNTSISVKIENKIALQGNFDPTGYSPPNQQMVYEMIDAFGKEKYIVNLGHGILPDIPLDHAKAFIDAVKTIKLNERTFITISNSYKII